MTEIQKINANAKLAFASKEYDKAFLALLQVGVYNFISYAQKENKDANKVNWFSHPEAGEYFWKEFILKEEVFAEFFKSDSGDQLLHNYFSPCNIHSLELESKLAKEFPEVLIKAIRVNQVFLKPEWIEHLTSFRLDHKYSLHQRFWDIIYKSEISNWNIIQKELLSISGYSLNDILTHCIIWLEEFRFLNHDKLTIYQLANIYSFFVELLMKTYPEKFKENIIAEDYFQYFLQVLTSTRSDNTLFEESKVSKLLYTINNWLKFREEIISPYSFDLSIQPQQENEFVYLNSTPEAFYKWVLNGIRYDLNQMSYQFQGNEFVVYLEKSGKVKIPGKTEKDVFLNKELTISKWATLILMNDLGCKTFQIRSNRIETAELLTPLLTYSRNRLNRYEQRLTAFCAISQNWIEAFMKLTNQSFESDIVNPPFFLMTDAEYKQLNQMALKDMPKDATELLIQLFRFEPKVNDEFNRFNTKYDVWQKPFIKIGDSLFSPMLFFANNDWFYTFAQTALTYRFLSDRNETKAIEVHLAEQFKLKGWKVKLISDKEASQLSGDVDIFVEDEDTVLFIQLKRTYFRLDLRDAYYESMNTDQKAARQLNDAEEYLKQSNSIYEFNHKPFKWIVSTSFENIGEKINGCSKINYFEILNLLRNLETQSLKDFIEYLESDRYLKAFAFSFNNPEMPIEGRQLITDVCEQISNFKHVHYRQLVFSDDVKTTESYNTLFEHAMQIYHSKNFNGALMVYDKCLLLRPNDGEVFFNIATIYADIGNYEMSFEYYEKALKKFPNDPNIMRDYSIALFAAGKGYKGLILAIHLFRHYPLYGEKNLFFEAHFGICLKRNLLLPAEIYELQSKWDKLNK